MSLSLPISFAAVHESAIGTELPIPNFRSSVANGAYAFFAAFIAVQIWLAATILLRLSEGRYVRVALWSCVLAFLVNIDAIWF